MLLLAVAAMVVRRGVASDSNRAAPLWGALSVGAFIGVSGLNNGVLPAPILIASHWLHSKQTAALSAPFILANSAGGWSAIPSSHFGLYTLAALAGAIAGMAIGLKGLGQAATRFSPPYFSQPASYCVSKAAGVLKIQGEARPVHCWTAPIRGKTEGSQAVGLFFLPS